MINITSFENEIIVEILLEEGLIEIISNSFFDIRLKETFIFSLSNIAAGSLFQALHLLIQGKSILKNLQEYFLIC